MWKNREHKFPPGLVQQALQGLQQELWGWRWGRIKLNLKVRLKRERGKNKSQICSEGSQLKRPSWQRDTVLGASGH